MQRGELVSDETVIELVRERVGCLRCNGGFLLDGFPRTLAQAEALNDILASERVALDAVASYVLPLEQVVARIGGRRVCTGCKAVYHVEAQPPAVAGICDKCGSALEQRPDDRPDAVRVRMEAYAQSTLPLRDYYRARGLLREVSADGDPEEVFARTVEALEPAVRETHSSNERSVCTLQAGHHRGPDRRRASTASDLLQAVAHGAPPPELATLVHKIRTDAFKVTDQDLDALRERFTEDSCSRSSSLPRTGRPGAARRRATSAGAGMRLGNVERGDRLSSKVLYASCASSRAFACRTSCERCGSRPHLFGAPHSAHTQVVMRGPSEWSVGERELFAAFVSKMNQCHF